MSNKQNNNQKKIKILKQALKKNLSKNEYIRVNSVLLNHIGYTHKEIIKINHKSAKALEGWITAFNKKGILGLMNKSDIQFKNYKLTREQKNEIKNIITAKFPKDFNLQGDFWNPDNLKQFITNKYNITYKSKTSYTNLLKYCGFSYQKVEYKDSRADKEYKDHMKVRLRKKLKKGVLTMSW